MELQSVYAVIVIFIASTTSVLSSLQRITRYGRFRVLHRHPGINKCSSLALHQKNLVGVRISKVTGKCEGLQHSWGLNQTIQSGYAYVKLQNVVEKYDPPLKALTNERSREVLNPEASGWLIPGVLSDGAKVDVTCAMRPDQGYAMYLHDLVGIMDIDRAFWCCYHNCSYDGNIFLITRMVSHVDNFDISVKIGKNCMKSDYIEGKQTPRKSWIQKISFQAQKHTIKFLIDGEQIATYSLGNFDLKMIRKINVFRNSHYVDDLEVHSYEFTEG